MSYQVGEELLREECYAFLGKSHSGRVGISSNALPAILPVHYAFVDDMVVFSAPSASELFRAAVGSVIAFQVDANNSNGCLKWSVLVRGIAQELTDDRLSNRTQAMRFGLGAAIDGADRFVTIPTTMISGRRFG